MNDPYDAAYSTNDDERDLLVQGNTLVPNIYMTLGDPFPSARAISISTMRRLQNLICRYLIDLAPGVDYLLSWLEPYQVVNPAINAELLF